MLIQQLVREFKYCPVCGTKLILHSMAKNVLVCTAHGGFYVKHRELGKKSVIIFRPAPDALGDPIADEEIEPIREFPLKPVHPNKKIPMNKAPYYGMINPTRIICIETGIEYATVRECAREMKLDRSSIFKHLKGERKTVRGYTFQRVENDTQVKTV